MTTRGFTLLETLLALMVFSMAVVALVEAGAPMSPNPEEVDRVFTTPLSVVFDMERYRLDSLMWEGERRRFFVVNHSDAYIWGATAALLRILYERLHDVAGPD